jgi:potassium inwardly-rectifying channel subfamily J
MFFGLLYRTVPSSCNTAIHSYFDGFSFSVSVLFTIGFGTNGGDVFFNECVWVQTIITMEVNHLMLFFCGRTTRRILD